MRILVVRHGDPDYENDSLTALGRDQAKSLSDVLIDQPIREIYSSPYGRAKETASYTAGRFGKDIKILPFLREMNDVCIPSKIRDDLAVWHVPPKQAMSYDENNWQNEEPFVSSKWQERHDEMVEGTKEFLGQFGIECLEKGYSFTKDLSDYGDIAVFCHQGAGLTWIAHLLQISYLDMWRTCYVSPTSYTTLLFEQSDENFGTFRMIGMGEIAHLVKSGIDENRTGLLYNRT